MNRDVGEDDKQASNVSSECDGWDVTTKIILEFKEFLDSEDKELVVVLIPSISQVGNESQTFEMQWAKGETLDEFLSESFITPISKTPAGGCHVYFKHRRGLSNGVRIIEGCDLRTNGGYVLVPPSYAEYQKNGKLIKGGYEWLTV